MHKPQSRHNFQSGNLLVLVLVFGSIFLIIISSFISSVIAQSQVIEFRFQQQQAGDIAEAGLNYYKWYLAHNSGDVSGGGVYEYTDPELGRIGEYELAVTGNSYCGQISSIEVESTGRTDANPDAVAIISATYKQPTVAEYSFINNEGVRFGDNRIITGPVHGNNWVQMDGAHNSFVGSGIATYNGGGGVFTATPPDPSNATPALFVYPIDPINFTGLTIDLSQMKTSADADGIYYGPTTQDGYKVVFNGNSTVDIYTVRTLTNYWSYSTLEGWHTGEYNYIHPGSEIQIANNLPIDPDCPVLFFEDKLWIEGAINQKVAIAAGLNSSNAQNNIVIDGNVTYVAGTNAGLVVIAEDDIDVGIDVPTDMTANGIYIAQNGRFGRNQYCDACGGPPIIGPWWNRRYTSYALPTILEENILRNRLTRLGSVISNQRGGTAWTSGGGVTSSGFLIRDTSFDRDQIDDPPPLTPTTNDVYELQDWRQEG
jgi:hypothetical protein